MSNGIHYLAIPGPSVIPDRVLRAMHRPSPNIYKGELIDLTASLFPDLKAVAGTQHNAVIYISNGHGVWEAALSNTLAEGDTVLAVVTGLFGQGWAQMAQALGLNVRIVDCGTDTDIDVTKVAEALVADKQGDIKAVMSVHVDTSTSVRNDIHQLRKTIDAAGHDALLMVDCIASLGCDDFQMDAWGVDVMVAACQKGLMTPAGMGFVFFNDKAAEARARLTRVSRYWDWTLRCNPDMFYMHFCGTAPTHHLYGLRQALDMINEEGLPNVYARHAMLAKTVWAAIDAWGTDGPMAFNISDPSKRSNAVTSIKLDAPLAGQLQDWTSENMGLTLGIGLGMEPFDGFFRIGHMGHLNGQMIMAALGGIDAGLKAIGAAHGGGALDAASTVLAAMQRGQATLGRARSDENPDPTGCCG